MTSCYLALGGQSSKVYPLENSFAAASDWKEGADEVLGVLRASLIFTLNCALSSSDMVCSSAGFVDLR